jgi:hypothetical protein
MAFDVTNAMRYNNIETVDAGFSAILAKINYADDTFRAGITYNDGMEERNGQLFVRKLGKGSVAGTSATSANGLDFTPVENQDTLLPLLNQYVLSKSEKVYQGVDTARKNGKLDQKKEVVVLSHAEAWNAQAMALILGGKNGGTTANNFTPHPNTDVVTADNAIDLILAARTQIQQANAQCNVCIVSPQCEAMLLTNYAKGKGFLPEFNENALRMGVVGRIFNLLVVRSNYIGAGSNITSLITGTPHADITAGATVAPNVNFIVYDKETLYIDTIFQTLRENPYPANFNGCTVDIQSIAGLLNTNPERMIVHQTVSTPNP